MTDQTASEVKAPTPKADAFEKDIRELEGYDDDNGGYVISSKVAHLHLREMKALEAELTAANAGAAAMRALLNRLADILFTHEELQQMRSIEGVFGVCEGQASGFGSIGLLPPMHESETARCEREAGAQDCNANRSTSISGPTSREGARSKPSEDQVRSKDSREGGGSSKVAQRGCVGTGNEAENVRGLREDDSIARASRGLLTSSACRLALLNLSRPTTPEAVARLILAALQSTAGAALLAEIAALRAKVDALSSALSDLMDHQNGCPLPKYETGWNKAMADASEALALLSEGEG